MTVRLSGRDDPQYVDSVPVPVNMDDDEQDLLEIHAYGPPAFFIININDSIE